MFRVVKELKFCYGHRLLHYQGKCANLHGHNARVEMEFSAAELDQRGMVLDFYEIKSAMKKFLEEKLDHKMILCREDPLCKMLVEVGEPVFVTEENPTAENLAKLIFRHAQSQGLPVTSVKLWENESSSAEYRP